MKKVRDENSKEKILASAVKLFAQKGFDAVSIREICKDAGVNTCMISYYFSGKKGLYQGIIDNIVEKQKEYFSSFLDLNKNPLEYTKQEQINLLCNIIDTVTDFLYKGSAKKDLIILLLKEQQNPRADINSPYFNYLRRLIGAVFNKPETDREIVFRTLFFISQINFPKILPSSILRTLGQNEFIQEDINIIKENAKFYLNAALKEAGIV